MKARKKYEFIVKIGNLPNGKAHCVKYHANNLVSFAAFLDVRWPTWRWFNVYLNIESGPGPQVANFTTLNRPQRPFL